MLPLDIAFVVAGLALLVAGGEARVRSAATIATRLGIPPVVVGLVVVSAATSSPELAVTVGALIDGEPGLAVGNVIGSNIAIILLILGISAMISPLVINRQIVRFDIPVMIVIAVLLLFFSLDGNLTLIEGLILFSGLVFHVIRSIQLGRREVREQQLPENALPLNNASLPIWLALILLIIGVGLLAVGSQLLVTGSVNIAVALGVSGLVVGLTVVAIGTSLPELATSIVALIKGERDMAVGNIVGSNIFNIGLVLGLPAMIFGGGIPIPAAAIAIDIPLMLAATVALAPLAFTGFKIARWEGTLFFLLYVAYILYVVLASTEHDAAQGFTNLMLWFVLPLVLATMVAVTAYELGLRKGRSAIRSK